MEEVNSINPREWVAVSVNAVFLSFLASALLPRLLSGLADTIEKQKMLEKQLCTEQQKLKTTLNALKIKNNELEQFAYLASNDLQEPLRMVNSFLTQLNSKYHHVLDEKGRRYIDFAVDGSQRMSVMINDLLQYSRIGRQEGSLNEINLQQVVEEVKKFQQKRISETGAIIKYDYLPVVNGYYTPLIQIFQNLISNALKYQRKDITPEINIEANEHPNEWTISVQDNGIGIDKEYFEKIFTIFQRLHNRTEYSGTGIGLAIVKKNIEILGGSVWVESEVGKGSTFYFTLKKIVNETGSHIIG